MKYFRRIFITILCLFNHISRAEDQLPSSLSPKCMLNHNCISLAAHCNSALKKWLFDKVEPTQDQADCMCSEGKIILIVNYN